MLFPSLSHILSLLSEAKRGGHANDMAKKCREIRIEQEWIKTCWQAEVVSPLSLIFLPSRHTSPYQKTKQLESCKAGGHGGHGGLTCIHVSPSLSGCWGCLLGYSHSTWQEYAWTACIACMACIAYFTTCFPAPHSCQIALHCSLQQTFPRTIRSNRSNSAPQRLGNRFTNCLKAEQLSLPV